MKNSDTKERLKALMRKHTEDAVASQTNPVVSLPFTQPVSTKATQGPAAAPTITIGGLIGAPQATGVALSSAPKPQRGWDRVTVRLMNHELEKLNNLIILTQQATRTSRVGATDIMRVALMRLGDSSAITAKELQALRADDGRLRHRNGPRN